MSGSDITTQEDQDQDVQQEDDKKQDQDDDHINLKVKSQDGDEIYFKIKKTTHLRKLFKSYCLHKSLELNSIVFLFEGRRIREDSTPGELEMEDGDEIDAMLHQTGGIERFN